MRILIFWIAFGFLSNICNGQDVNRKYWELEIGNKKVKLFTIQDSKRKNFIWFEKNSGHHGTGRFEADPKQEFFRMVFLRKENQVKYPYTSEWNFLIDEELSGEVSGEVASAKFKKFLGYSQ